MFHIFPRTLNSQTFNTVQKTNMNNIIQWNINGCIQHYNELRKLIADFKPFCVSLQETHFRHNQNVDIKGYKHFRRDDDIDQRAKGGVCIFLKKEIPATLITVTSSLQVVAIRIEYPITLTICNIYLPRFDWHLDDLRQILLSLPSPILFVGDFNAHSPSWGSKKLDLRGSLIDQLIDEFNLIILNTGDGTYLNSRSQNFSVIDLAMCSPNIAPIFNWILLEDYLYSDHFPIQLQLIGTSNTFTRPPRWRLEKADWNKFREAFTNPTIRPSINETIKIFSDSILHAANVSIPKRGYTVTSKQVPWWTKEISDLVRKKKQALNRFKKFPNLENMIEFKKARSLAKRKICECKAASWKKFTSSISSQTSAKEVWRKTRCIIGKNQPSLPIRLRVDDKTVADPKEIAEILGKHFEGVNSTENYDKVFQVKKRMIENEAIVVNSAEDTAAYNSPLTLQELEVALGQSKKSAPGPDEIPYEFLKQLPDCGKITLLNIFQKIWKEGNYPDQWREATIIPILKPGKDLKDPTSYRPISLTSSLSKTLEKIINRRLIWFLENNNLIQSEQMGFRKRKSTTDNLAKLEYAVQHSFAHRKHLVAIFFDLEKAYDLAWRRGIINKLIKWNIRGNMLRFIISFLQKRTFRVQVSGEKSTLRCLENGIPQGSTLSVTLFLIAVNDLTTNLPAQIQCCSYVDDQVIFFSHKNIKTIQETLQPAINKIVDNAESIGFRFSTSKTHAMHFCRLRKEHDDPTLFIKNAQITYKASTRFLGLIFDKKLNWKEHINKLRTQCHATINLMRCLTGLSWGADQTSLLRIYRALILSKIDYGCAIYGSARKSYLKSLDRINTLGLRLATGAFRTSPVDSILCESGFLPLEIRRQKFVLNHCFNVLSQLGHANYNIVTNPDEENIFHYRPSITRPIFIRFHEILRKAKIKTPTFWKFTFHPTAPWILRKPKILFDCKKFPKSINSSQVILKTFWDVLNKHQGATIIYTDGSKTSNGVGSAFYVKGKSHFWTLDKWVSVYTAELYAIWQALLYISMSDESHFLICTDSESVLQSLSNPFSDDPLIQNVFHIIHEEGNQKHKHIIFLWVPSHVGIPGNAIADKAAREGALQCCNEEIPLRPDDGKLLGKLIAQDFWQTEWKGKKTFLKNIIPNVYYKKPPLSYLPRRVQVVLTRLRIGHTKATKEHLLRGGNRPRCFYCGDRLTILHIFKGCVILSQLVIKYKLPQDLPVLLNPNNKYAVPVCEFLKEAQLFTKI